MTQQSNVQNVENVQNIIDLLKCMYEDNIQHIERMSLSIDNIRNNNTQIINTLVRLIDNQGQVQGTNTNTNTNTRTNTMNTRSNTNTRTARNYRHRHRDIDRSANNETYTFEVRDYYPFTSFTGRDISSILNTFLGPVEVYPTPAQILRATRRVLFTDLSHNVNRSCPISLEPFNDTDQVTLIRHCGHVFNSDQLSAWFRSSCRCPVCRYDIRNYSQEPNTTTSETNTDERQAPVSASVDASNNSFDQNQEETLQNNLANTFTRYFDIILDSANTNTNTQFYDYPTDTVSLNTILNALQRRQN
jgi:hypothetical protein